MVEPGALGRRGPGRHDRPSRPSLTRWFAALVALTASLTSVSAQPSTSRAGEFRIADATTELRSEVYWLRATIDYGFSDEAVEALKAGVPLTVVLESQATRVRPLLDEEIAASLARYRLHKHTLSGRYLITRLDTGRVRSFEDPDSLATGLGEVNGLPVVAANLLPEGHRYRLRVRTYLEIDALPSPLKPLAYIDPSWRLDSGWYSWPLHP